MKNFVLSREVPMLVEARARKKGFIPILEVLIFFAVLIVASSVQGIPTAIVTGAHVLNKVSADPAFLSTAQTLLNSGDITGYFDHIMKLMQDLPSWVTIVNLFATVLSTIVVILFCRVIQKRRYTSLGLGLRRAVPEYLLGAVLGIAMISATALLGVAFGAIKLSFAKFNVWLFLLFMLGYFFQGMSEEVMCRGYLMVSITRRNNVWRAVLVSSLVFSLLHLFNPGYGILPFINILLCGAVFGIYAIKRNSLWGACAMHSFWNFFQGNFFGISVSGTGAGTNASVMQAQTLDAHKLLTGGTFGIEGSVATTIVMTAALLIVIFALPQRKRA